MPRLIAMMASSRYKVLMMNTETDLLRELEIERKQRQTLELHIEQFRLDPTFIKKKETPLHNAVLSMSDGFLLHDLEYNIKTVNNQLHKIYYKNTINTETPEELLKIMQHDSYPGIHNKGVIDSTFEVTLESGRTVIIKAHQTTDGNIVSIHQDVTHKRAYEIEQLRLLKKLYSAQKLEAIGRMTGVIAHDFNNIIAAILGYSGFLVDDLNDRPELRTYAERITQSAKRGSDIIENILNFSKKIDIPYKATDMNELIKEARNIISPSLQNDIIIKVKLTKEQLHIAANASQMTQLLMNLLTNARDAYKNVPNNKKRIYISTGKVESYDLNDKSTEYLPRLFSNSKLHSIKKGILQFSTPCLRITITDSGCGMDNKTMKQLFEPFFSTKKNDNGTGLGLFGVSGIIAEHGGGLKIYSSENVGTHCVLIIPLEAESLTSTRSLKRPIKVPNSGNIMVIDDEPVVGLMLAETLTRSGIPAIYYENAHSAIDAFKADPNIWRAIICDQMMPTIKGTEVFKKVRVIKEDILFILCSGNAPEIDHDELLNNNGMFLRKPVDKNHLLAIID